MQTSKFDRVVKTLFLSLMVIGLAAGILRGMQVQNQIQANTISANQNVNLSK